MQVLHCFWSLISKIRRPKASTCKALFFGIIIDKTVKASEGESVTIVCGLQQTKLEYPLWYVNGTLYPLPKLLQVFPSISAVDMKSLTIVNVPMKFDNTFFCCYGDSSTIRLQIGM